MVPQFRCNCSGGVQEIIVSRGQIFVNYCNASLICFIPFFCRFDGRFCTGCPWICRNEWPLKAGNHFFCLSSPLNCGENSLEGFRLSNRAFHCTFPCIPISIVHRFGFFRSHDDLEILGSRSYKCAPAEGRGNAILDQEKKIEKIIIGV